MTSKQPQRYIDREGVEEMAVARNYHNDEHSKLTREKLQLQEEMLSLKARLAELTAKPLVSEYVNARANKL